MLFTLICIKWIISFIKIILISAMQINWLQKS